ncbi:hypothetical protein [Frankia sp. AiPa1]|uniref:hypothetical protein n=1 Tax=Frankia sp. AiPa1 TaxID=573492 RepID=UPI00202B4A58|nr:hypothetical protein [Frankia sp. AiPa1]MCL9762491.1 hypothetical protein [Frankia sp. AiPa1]
MRPRITPTDRDRLRTQFGWRYEAHARAVLGTLALHPGLRSAGSSPEILTGLVCTRAYLAAHVPAAGAGRADAHDTPTEAERAVDLALRGDGSTPAEAFLIARCAAVGLARLPAVVGAVYHDAVPDLAVIRHYRPGELLTEPAFLEVSTTLSGAPSMSPGVPTAPSGAPGMPPGVPTAPSAGPPPVGAIPGTVRYVIWSSTARRTGLLSADLAGRGPDAPDALLGAGTCFVVLAVEPGPAQTGGVTVLLREVLAGRRADPGLDERILGRLRETRADTAPAGTRDAPVSADHGDDAAGPRPWASRAAIGISADGRLFDPDGARPAPDVEPGPTP